MPTPLRVVFDDRSVRVLMFNEWATVKAAVAVIMENKPELAKFGEHGLVFQDKWMKDEKPWFSYGLQAYDDIYLRRKNRELRVQFLDDWHVKFVLGNETVPVSALTKALGKKIGIYSTEEFSLRVEGAPDNAWLDPDITLFEQPVRVKPRDVLLFQRKIHYADIHLGIQLSDFELHLKFMQAKAVVLKNESSVFGYDDIVQLAALQLQAEFGDHNPDKHIFSKYPSSDSFLPAAMAALPDIEKNVFVVHKQLAGMLSSDAKCNYLDESRRAESRHSEDQLRESLKTIEAAIVHLVSQLDSDGSAVGLLEATKSLVALVEVPAALVGASNGAAESMSDLGLKQQVRAAASKLSTDVHKMIHTQIGRNRLPATWPFNSAMRDLIRVMRDLPTPHAQLAKDVTETTEAMHKLERAAYRPYTDNLDYLPNLAAAAKWAGITASNLIATAEEASMAAGIDDNALPIWAATVATRRLIAMARADGSDQADFDDLVRACTAVSYSAVKVILSPESVLAAGNASVAAAELVHLAEQRCCPGVRDYEHRESLRDASQLASKCVDALLASTMADAPASSQKLLDALSQVVNCATRALNVVEPSRMALLAYKAITAAQNIAAHSAARGDSTEDKLLFSGQLARAGGQFAKTAAVMIMSESWGWPESEFIVHVKPLAAELTTIADILHNREFMIPKFTVLIQTVKGKPSADDKYSNEVILRLAHEMLTSANSFFGISGDVDVEDLFGDIKNAAN